MIIALALLGYAALLLTAGAAALARARWTARAPRLALTAWLTLTGSAVGSVILGGAALVVPTARVSTGLAALLASCAMALQAGYAHPGGAAMAGAGAVLGLAVTARVGWCAAVTLGRAVGARRRHRRVLTMTGRRDQRLGAVLVERGEAAAWCLQGAAGQVVLTTAAVRALDDAQLAAVMAHERAHQRGRHHLLVALAGSLAIAFPRVPAFRHGHEQVARLVELLADDAAAAASPRLTVAEALLALAAPAPAAAAALGAGGSATAIRVRRLIAAPAPIGRARTAAGLATIAALAVFPLVLLAGPAATTAGMKPCASAGPHTPRDRVQLLTTHRITTDGEFLPPGIAGSPLLERGDLRYAAAEHRRVLSPHPSERQDAPLLPRDGPARTGRSRSGQWLSLLPAGPGAPGAPRQAVP